MTPLVWDAAGEKVYRMGVDRGVLYLHDGTVVPWNGLTGIEEDSTSEVQAFYLNGIKYLENIIPGDFVGKLKAFTYPEEFDVVNGLVPFAAGFDLYDQPGKSFNLSYRTKIGNDLSQDAGYKIHILYNVVANPDSTSYDTIEDTVHATEFTWSLSGIPEKLTGFRPTVHISIDSTQTPSEVMKALEEQLYGTDTSEPRLLSISEVASYFGYLAAFILIDHGDGSWTGIDPAGGHITMLDETTFQIDNVDVSWVDEDTYTISVSTDI